MGFGITTIVFFVLIATLISQGINMVPQGFNWTVERFGKYTRTLNPGLHLIVPIIDRIGKKINMMEQVLDVPPQEIISADNAQITTDAVCFYQVQDAPCASYEVNQLDRAMQNLVMTNIRAVLGSMELDEMLSRRDHINSLLLTKVDEATNPWGVKVTRIEIRDIAPPQDLVDSMARQMKAEREKRAQILEAEGQREATIKVAEGNKQAQILAAESQKQAQILKAEGALEAAQRKAQARERLAQAEAKANADVSESISNGDVRALHYFVAQKYVEALQSLASANNSKTIMMPLEAGNVIGSLAGVKELLFEGTKKTS